MWYHSTFGCFILDERLVTTGNLLLERLLRCLSSGYPAEILTARLKGRELSLFSGSISSLVLGSDPFIQILVTGNESLQVAVQ